jgi:hypothetical protein
MTTWVPIMILRVALVIPCYRLCLMALTYLTTPPTRILPMWVSALLPSFMIQAFKKAPLTTTVSLVRWCLFSMNELTWLLGLNILEKFVSRGAFCDSSSRCLQTQCHPGTRERVLEMIQGWALDADGASRILWLYGQAGAGKSAIAQTIAEYCHQTDNLAASFFFFRVGPDRNTADRLFPTLAHQLCLSVPGIAPFISAAMETDPLLPMQSLDIQCERLIIEPFEQIAAKYSAMAVPRLIVIIDGVDECADEAMQQRFLTLIGDAVYQGRIPLRFLICSRPELHIRDVFDRMISSSSTSRLVLDDSVDSHASIERYLIDEFERISLEQGLGVYSWPSQGAIDRLVHNSAGQFIYASTVIRFVEDKYSNPMQQLDIVLGLRAVGSSPFADLDRLHIEILSRQPDQVFIANLIAILIVLSTSSHLVTISSIGIINALLNLEEGKAFAKLRGLLPLLEISETYICVRHASFLEFLQSPARCGQYYTSAREATRRFLDLLVAAVARYASMDLKHASEYDCSNLESLARMAAAPPPYAYQLLPPDDWENVLYPIQKFADMPFQASDFDVFYRMHSVHQIVLRLLTFKSSSISPSGPHC